MSEIVSKKLDKLIKPQYQNCKKARATLQISTSVKTLAECQVSESDSTVVNLLLDNNADGAMLVIYGSGDDQARWTLDGVTNPSSVLGFKSVGDFTIIYLGDHPSRPGGLINELQNFRIIRNGTADIYAEVHPVCRV